MSLCAHCGTAGCVFCRRVGAPVPGSDPWAMDAFAPPTITPHQVEEGGPKLPTTPKPPKPIPELDRLFAIQNDANKALHALREFQDKHRDLTKETLALERHIENTYRVINRYLRDYASGGNL